MERVTRKLKSLMETQSANEQSLRPLLEMVLRCWAGLLPEAHIFT
jgi:hypothetical protein